MEIQNILNRLRFEGRKNLWGPLRLRKGLPAVLPSHKEEEFYSLVLNRSMSPEATEGFRMVVDAGCRNWSYVGALARFFPKAWLLGIELDGLKRYRNLFRRIDYARAYAKNAQKDASNDPQSVARSIRALSLDFLELSTLSKPPQPGKVLFCFFFPFVSEGPCLAWGLPTTFSHFAPLIRHALKLGGEAGQGTEILSLHQGAWEAEIARKVYKDAGLEIASEQIIPVTEFQDLWPGRYELFLIQCSNIHSGD